MQYDIPVWVDAPFARAVSQSNLNKAIWFALKDAGIVIAFPQVESI